MTRSPNLATTSQASSRRSSSFAFDCFGAECVLRFSLNCFDYWYAFRSSENLVIFISR